MTPTELLRMTGEVLYGTHWKADLARDLGMSDRHMRRLASGDADLTPGMTMDLLRIAKERVVELEEAIDELRWAEIADLRGPSQ
jgi:methylphosphotriester-DNA--protein-cysteine methyltransferase